MKKNINFIITLLLFGIFTYSYSFAKNIYFIYKDIPAMPGMYFEQPKILKFSNGNIVTIYASINAKQNQIKNYYSHSLSQFGWTKSENNKFYRENNTLQYNIVQSQNHGQIIIFNLIENN